jgi:hypothetical protein
MLVATVAVLLALALASSLTLYAGVLRHPAATGAPHGATGYDLQDMPDMQRRPAGAQVWLGWLERCATREGKYKFDRNEVSDGAEDGSARTAGGRIYAYLATEDDDEYAPIYCQALNAY